jgi:hypothetical protein
MPQIRESFLLTLTILASSAGAASASDILDPASFASSGVLNLTSGAYVIDTSGGAGGAPILETSGGTVLAVGATFNQGGYSYSGGTFDPTIAVLDFSSVTVGAGATITVSGANPLALLSRGAETIDGQVFANGAPGQTGAAGGAAGAGGPGGAGGGAGGVWFSHNGYAGSGPGGGETPCGGPAICSDGQNGGYGGGGINGPFTGLSPTYGNLQQYLLAGSGGAGAGVAIVAPQGAGGGGGGGAVEFGAATAITFGPASLVEADGGLGGSGAYYGGTGSGGGLIFAAPSIGADPFDGIRAIGGGGGRVLFLDTTASVPGVSVNVDGGAFGDQPGTVNFATLAGGGVPEPGVWAMLIIGLGLVGAPLRRRRARAWAAPVTQALRG